MGQTIILFIVSISISQILLPLLAITIVIVLALFYFVFFSSIYLKKIIGYVTYVFVLIADTICTSAGISVNHGEFIGEERYSNFLTMITFLISIPYILSFWLRMVRKFIQFITGDDSVALIFKPAETLISVNVLRYTLYILLFSTSVFTYSANISQPDHVFLLLKESLLEFVLLDTVIYSIISDLKNRKIINEQQEKRRYYLPLKYDLEFVLSAITIYNLKNNEISARINFSVDITESKKWKKPNYVSELDDLLAKISTDYHRIDILEQEIKEALRRIIDLIG